MRLTRVSEVFVITHAPSDRLVNRACFMYSLNGDILPTVLENSFRCETMEGRKVDGIERQRSLLCVYRFYGDRKKVWDPFFSPPPRKRIVDYRSARQISRSLWFVRKEGTDRRVYRLAAIILNNLLVEYPIKVLLPRQLIYWCRKKKSRANHSSFSLSRSVTNGIPLSIYFTFFLRPLSNPCTTLEITPDFYKPNFLLPDGGKEKKKEKNLWTVKLKP